jgi:restriction endonuclease Mrr
VAIPDYETLMLPVLRVAGRDPDAQVSTPEAVRILASVADYSERIILIDGPALVELMIDHDVGVSVTTTYQLKRLDSDFFDEADSDA